MMNQKGSVWKGNFLGRTEPPRKPTDHVFVEKYGKTT